MRRFDVRIVSRKVRRIAGVATLAMLWVAAAAPYDAAF